MDRLKYLAHGVAARRGRQFPDQGRLAFSARRDLGRQGHQLRRVLRQRHQGRGLPVRSAPASRSSSASSCRNTPTRSGTATCPTSRPATSTAIACTVRTSRNAGHRFNPNKLLLDPYARAYRRAEVGSGSLRLHRWSRGDDLTFDERDSAPFMPKCVVVDPEFRLEGRAAAAQRALGPHHHLRSARARLHQAASRRAGEAARHLCRPRRPKQVIDYIKSLGVTSVELLPIHTFVNDSHLLEKGLTNYWGYNSIGFFAPDPRYAAEPRDSLARVQGDGGALPRCRARSDSGRGLQPHRRRQRARSDAVVQGHRQRLLLPAAAGPEALLHQRHRHRQHAEPQPSARHPDGDRQPALLGAANARRRLPLRSRHHSGARAEWLRQPERLPEGLRPGSGARAR